MAIKQKFKIAQIVPYYYPSIGGVEGVVQYVSEELVRRGHNVHVLTANRNHRGNPPLNRPLYETINGVAIHRLKSLFGLGHMSFFPGIIFHLINFGFDIIHTHVYRHPHTELAYLVAKKKSIPFIIHGHGPFFSRKSTDLKKAMLYGLYDWQAKQRILKHVDLIIALTKYEKQQYLNLGVQPEKVTIVPNAAANECFESVDAKLFIEKYNLRGKRIILYLGLLTPYKRPDLLIRALPKLIQKIPDVFLLLVGPDDGMCSRIEDLAKHLNVENYYSWIGPLQGQEKNQALEAAEFLILPSDEEPFGLVLLEAMAHGKPVIGSDAVGPSEIIDNNETGFVIKRGCVDDFVKAALKLLTNPLLCDNMGRKAREVAVTKYSVSRVVNQIENLYYQLSRD